jgi:hypothetical protein
METSPEKSCELGSTQETDERYVVHAALCNVMHDLYIRKNQDYGNSFAVLRKEYPPAICIRLFDKYLRLKTLIFDAKDPRVVDESIEDTLMDIANYCVMELTERYMDKCTKNAK